MYDQLLTAAQTSENAAKDLAEREAQLILPDECDHVWPIFLELHEARQSSGEGPNPIPYSEIMEYARANKIDLDPAEIKLIRIADAEYIRFANRIILAMIEPKKEKKG